MPLILGTNSIKDTGYDVANSVRFNGSNTYMTRTMGTPTNADKFSFSFWVKRSKLGVQQSIFRSTNGTNDSHVTFRSGDTLEFQEYGGLSTIGEIETNQVFRDQSAWYSILLVWDSGNSTAGNRMRMYVNGTEVTSFGTDSNPSQNADSFFNKSGEPLHFGRTDYGGGGNYFSGYVCEMVMCDGQALVPSDIGEFDSDSPNIFKPKNVSGLTFGNNGFYLNFEDSSDLGKDVSGNGNHFTESNFSATDQSTDTCTNNFATWNPLNVNDSMGTFSNGNLEYDTSVSSFRTAFATFGASQGKWYFECKRITGSSFSIGIISLDYKNRTKNVSYIGGAGDATNNIGYLKDGNTAIGGSETSGYAAYGNGDTVMVAMDIDNGAVYFGVNGTWGNSGNPESGASKTGARSFTPSGETWTFAVSVFNSHWEANFGSPMYAITSSNADDNDYGNFEFDVPAGFYSLCTKNLAEYG